MANIPSDPNFIPSLTPQTGGTFKQELVEAIYFAVDPVGSPPTYPQDAYKIVRLNANGQIDPSLGGGQGGGGGGTVGCNRRSLSTTDWNQRHGFPARITADVVL